VLWVDYYRVLVVVDGLVEHPLLPEGEPSVVVEICLVGFDVNSLGEALNSFIKITLPIQADSLIVVSVGVVRVNLDGHRVVGNGQVKLPDFVIRKSTIEQGFEMVWHYVEGLSVLLDCEIIRSLLPGIVAAGMELFCFLPPLWVYLR